MVHYYTQDLPFYFLAVRLENTKWINWDRNGTSFRFFLNQLNLSKNSSDTEQLIAVSRAFSDVETSEIEQIAESIQFICQKKLPANTIVVGLNAENQIEKTGQVSEASGIGKEGVVIDISWSEESTQGNLEEGIIALDHGPGFLLLTTSQVDRLHFGIDFLDQIDSSVTPAPEESFFESDSDYEDMDDADFDFHESVPKVITEEKIERQAKKIPQFKAYRLSRKPKPSFELSEREEEFFRKAPVNETDSKKDPGGEVFVFYGTNRAKTGNKDYYKFFGSTLGALETGWLKINIPPGHEVGKMERPFKFLFIKRKAKKKKHILISDMLETNEDRFYELLKHRLSKSDKSALIFIHGYNNSFAACAWRTAQICYDVNFKGVGGFFSWPSAAKPHFYGSDIEYADASVLDFETFLKGIVTKTGVEEIHLVAHSMGNRILTSSISSLQQDGDFRDELHKIYQLIMAAPDVDQEVFKRNIMPYFQQVGQRRTLYASDRDKALAFSEWLRVKRPRLGDGGKSVFVENGIDSIDASNINPPKWLDHSYVFETKPLISDLKRVIYQNDGPEVRDLKQRKKNGIDYWVFPK
ncbi:alpha/beta hydrolase [Gracilimonas mengyeensis]|uniref:Esterase/lipase superfamily enzyme n=1 Tax=Gracilimonas mengyeensis TaxID=1302730 RepID=A0A521C6R4_9BACT|nr:alpha/beta hydrolase [Gracilimonas mengyeensis]SMO54370.1 Esterase/lipase superfamily enzyme [Gracilimonas mengyeensis]